ncbi:MAG: radical SAM protein with 4Fe4S-binding SPASM domain [Planctomycetota bacterium]|jgi:radical SAM protein with 4Fe4S-binding SPASM domain
MSDPAQAPKYRRELASFVALNTALAQQKTVWDSKPYFLEYSTNSSCNLRCKMCGQSENPPVVTTPKDKRDDLFDQLLPHATIITPSATSEPLLNNMKTLIPKLEEHQVSLNIITNGALMTPEVLEMMLPHLHQLTFSIDSQIKEIFEMMRAPANFEDVTEKARLSVARCKEAGLPVTIHMVLVTDNVPHLEGFVDYVVDDLGAHDITVLELLESTNDFKELDAFGVLGEEVVGSALEKMRARCEERGVNLRIEVHAPHGGEYTYFAQPARINSAAVMDIMHVELSKSHLGFCPHVMSYLKVEPDGEAFPCCRGPRELRLGNVIEDGFEAVWNGKPMQKLRQQMFDGDLPKVCQGCAVLEAPKWFL